MDDGHALLRRRRQFPRLRRAHALFGEQFPQALGAAGGDDDRPALAAPRRPRQVADRARVGRRGLERQRERQPAALRAMVAAQRQPARRRLQRLQRAVPVRERRGKPHRQTAPLLFGETQTLRVSLQAPRRLLRLERLVEDDDRVLRQVVEQRMPQEKARVQRPVVRRNARQQIGEFVLNALPLALGRVCEVQTPHEFVHGFPIRRRGERLRRRKHDDGVRLLVRPLRVRVEEANGVRLVAPQVYPRRALAARAEHVNDAPAPRRRPRMIDHRPDGVAHSSPMRQHRLDSDAVAAPDRPRSLAQRLRAHRLLKKPGDGGHDDGRRALSAAKRPQRADALPRRARLDGQPLVGENLRLREMQERRVRLAVRLQLRQQTARVVGLGAEREHRAP